MGWLDPDRIWETARLERLTGDLYSADWPDTFTNVPPHAGRCSTRRSTGVNPAGTHAQPDPLALSSRGSGAVPNTGARPARPRDGS